MTLASVRVALAELSSRQARVASACVCWATSREQRAAVSPPARYRRPHRCPRIRWTSCSPLALATFAEECPFAWKSIANEDSNIYLELDKFFRQSISIFNRSLTSQLALPSTLRLRRRCRVSGVSALDGSTATPARIYPLAASSEFLQTSDASTNISLSPRISNNSSNNALKIYLSVVARSLATWILARDKLSRPRLSPFPSPCAAPPPYVNSQLASPRC